MSGLKRLCRLYGGMEFVSQNGKKTVYVWDYAKNKPRIKSEMTKDEIKESEKAKWIGIKNVDIK